MRCAPLVSPPNCKDSSKSMATHTAPVKHGRSQNRADRHGCGRGICREGLLTEIGGRKGKLTHMYFYAIVKSTARGRARSPEQHMHPAMTELGSARRLLCENRSL